MYHNFLIHSSADRCLDCFQFSSVQLLSLILQPQASLSITHSRRLLKLMSIESVMPSNHLILCHPLLLPPSIFPTIRVYTNESVLHIRWPKYLSFSFSISPSEDWFPLGWTGWISLQSKSLLQHHSSNASILQCSDLFIGQPSHPYMTAGKNIAWTRQMFIGKVMSLLFNMLSRLVITFLPRSKRLLISSLQSPSAVILEPKKIKSVTVSIISPSVCHEVMEPDAMILVFWMLSFKPTFSLSFTVIKRLFYQEALLSRGIFIKRLFFTFCFKGGVICISEVIDISPGNLDSSLCFIQSSISRDILCI